MKYALMPPAARACTVCGYPLDSDSKSSTCRRNCGQRARDLNGDQEFIAVDGEGVTNDDGSHEYVLISCGDRSLHRGGKSLEFAEIVAFLYNCFLDKPKAAYVGYFLGYDFTNWLKTLPAERANRLLTKQGIASRTPKSNNRSVPFPVAHKGWEFDIMGFRRFKLRPEGKHPWMYICDAGSYFQTSFLKAVDPSKWDHPIVTQEEWDVLLEGKSKRSTAGFDDDMVRYNVTENRIMAKLMSTLDVGLRSAGLIHSRQEWFGPGKAAQKWLLNVKCIESSTLNNIVPRAFLEAARASYYGGWFDVFMHGHIPGRTFGYDINSAYPFAIANLPCLEHASWKSHKGAFEPTQYSLVKARVKQVFPVLPHRTPKGHICRPLQTEGWFWWPELQAAQRLGADVEILEGHTMIVQCDHKPLATVADLYQKRLEVGKNTPEGKAYKLIINSLYGKFAQSIGMPRMANPIYASLITMSCRAQIINAIADHPTGMRDLVMVATDGVYFRAPHPSLTISKKLGEWEEELKDNLTTFMPGVNWDDHTREDLTQASIRSRGVNAHALASKVSEIDKAYGLLFSLTGEWPSVTVPVFFGMVSPMQALARGRWEECGRVYAYDPENPTAESTKQLSANPVNKRIPIPIRDGDIWRTEPYDVAPGGIESAEYDKEMGMFDENIITQDGYYAIEVADFMRDY